MCLYNFLKSSCDTVKVVGGYLCSFRAHEQGFFYIILQFEQEKLIVYLKIHIELEIIRTLVGAILEIKDD